MPKDTASSASSGSTPGSTPGTSGSGGAELRQSVRQVLREELATLLMELAAKLRGGAPLAGATTGAPPVGATAPGRLDARTLAILTAAACAVVGGPVHVRRVTFLNHNTISGWAETGRISIQASHNLRK